jgi:hypothetical protein
MIRQIIKYSLLLSLVLAAILWALKQELTFLGLVLGSMWGCLNLFLIQVLTKQLLIRKNIPMSGGLILIKFPLLYWIGYQLLTFTEINPWWVMAGLSLVFMVAFVATLIPAQEELA